MVKEEVITDRELNKMFLSEFCLTDNNTIALFGDYALKLFMDDKKINSWETFLLTEENLDIKINRNKLLEPIERGDFIVFNSIGQVKKELVYWFMEKFPHCIFYPITEWFGKRANTLVCILGNPHGKPVGVVKTTN
jgi:hypothetical protein